MTLIMLVYLAVVALIQFQGALADTGATYIGCYADKGARDLEGEWLQHASMTINMCRAFCQAQDMPYFGLQAGSYCFCGASYGAYGEVETCTSKCAGDHTTTCGGGWTNSVYSVDNPGQIPASEEIGCYRDTGNRDLEGLYFNHGKMTVNMCASLCEALGNPFYGLQAGSWCFCGDSYGEFGEATNCDIVCSGNDGENCGGGWANRVFQLEGVSTDEDEGVEGVTYIGCFRDQGTRDLAPNHMVHDSMTISMCRSFCQALGTEYFGVQAGKWCFCGNSYGSYGDADNCDIKCAGRHLEMCGGGWANQVYFIAQPGRVPKSDLLGCYRDAGDRDLGEIWMENGAMTVDVCASFCGNFEYTYFGVQAGRWCFCGDTYGKHGEADNCDLPCAGSAMEMCGGGWANNVYAIGSGFKGGDEEVACQADIAALKARNAELEQELAQVRHQLQEATTTDPPPIATPDPSVAITETAHEFTLSNNGIAYILETTPMHVALEADNYCEQYGMKLAPIPDPATLAALQLQLSSLGIADLNEVAVGQRSSVNMERDVIMEDFNAAGWSCVTFVPDGDTYKLVSKKCQGERPILCAAIPEYC